VLGQTVSHYKILEQLGKGGMGIVYMAEDTNLKRTVALKFIDTPMFDGEESRIRFVNEAQLAASLNHPNISTVYEIDEVETMTFIAMEFIKGKSLKEIIRSGPLSVERTLEIAVQVAGGLQEAHEHDIVHRDIKSSNIMLTSKDRAKIMDFGLAQHSDQTRVTKTSNVVGTVAFMSPEQAAGEPLDGRTDIWSFGVVIYQMLTGQLPFEGGNDQSTLYGILNQDPKPVSGLRSGIPLELEMIINRCLDKDKDARYQTALDLKADLKRLIRNLDSGRLFSTQTMAVVRSKPKKGKWIRWWTPLISLSLVMAAVLVLTPVRESFLSLLGWDALPDAQYLAILPFSASEDDPQLKTISADLVDTLTNQITQLESLQESLQVVPHSEVRDIDSAAKAWDMLRVNLVIAGQMVTVLDKVKLMLSLNSTNPPRQLKSLDIEVLRSDIHTLYEKAVYAVVKMLAFEMKPGMDVALETKGTDDPDAWVYFIEGLGLLNNPQEDDDLDQAVQLFGRAISKDPDYALAVVRLGDVHMKKWDQTKEVIWLDQAKAYYIQAMGIDDSLPDVHYALGKMLTDEGEYEQAEKHLTKGLELNPNDYEMLLELAYTYEKLGRMEEAEREFKQVIAQKPDYWRGYRHLGVFYFYQGRYDEAEQMFLRIKTLAPTQTSGYDLLGVVYFRTKKYDQAIENFERSVTIEPSYTNYANLGTIYFFHEKNYRKAKEMFQRASVLENNYLVKGNLADACRQLGERENADKHYREAIQLAEKVVKVHRKDARAYSTLGRYYALISEKSRALERTARALDLEPENLEVLLICAKAYELTGLRQKTLEVLEKIVQSGGGLGDIEESPDFTELRNDPRYQILTNTERQ